MFRFAEGLTVYLHHGPVDFRMGNCESAPGSAYRSKRTRRGIHSFLARVLDGSPTIGIHLARGRR